MRKLTFVLPLAAVTWLASTGCGSSEPGGEVHTAGLIPGGQPGAAVAEADSQGIVTRRLWAGLEDMPVGSPTPDGRYVTDVDWDSTGDVTIRDLHTGEIRQVTNEASWGAGQWAEGSRVSPDGRWVAYTWHGPDGADEPGYGVRVVPLEGGQSRVLVRNGGYQYAQPFDWSADGSQVLVGLTGTDGAIRIGLVDVASAGLRTVTSVTGLGSMALSPDGRYVAYDIQREASSFDHTVHIVGADGSGDREVTGPYGNNTVVGWEPSGRYLLYYGDHSGSPSVWALRVTEGRPRGEPVLVRSDLWHLMPLGFTGRGDLVYGVNTGKVDMFSVLTDPETGAPIGEPQSVTPHYQAGTTLYPRWSPDGRYLAYRRTPPAGQGMGHSLVIRDVESGEFREIGLDLGVVLTPDWSTDGRFLVLYVREGRTRRTNRQGIYRIDVQTGEHGFVHTIEGGLRGTAWLDEGRTVLFRETGGGAGPGGCRFATVDLTSGREREVYRWRCYSADWFWALSPDKRTIAAVFDRGGRPEQEGPWTLRVVSLGDGTTRDLAEFYPWVGNNAPGTLPVSEIYWTPDSRSFRWRGCSSPDELIETLNRCPNWSFDVATGERRRLADDAPMGSIHPDGRRVAFADGKTAYEVWVMEGYLPIREAGPGRDR